MTASFWKIEIQILLIHDASDGDGDVRTMWIVDEGSCCCPFLMMMMMTTMMMMTMMIKKWK